MRGRRRRGRRGRRRRRGRRGRRSGGLLAWGSRGEKEQRLSQEEEKWKNDAQGSVRICNFYFYVGQKSFQVYEGSQMVMLCGQEDQSVTVQANQA